MGEHVIYVDDAYFTLIRARHNRTATTDPTVNDDATVGATGGYAVNSLWANISAGTVWICRDATIGAADWERIDISDHDDLTGVSVDDHHSQVHDHSAGGDDGGTVAHGVLTGVGADDHHTKYTDGEADARIALHAAIAAAHHTKYLDSEAVTAIEATADYIDLTDGGETTLHSHAGSGGGGRRVVMRPGITSPPEPVSNPNGDGWVYMEVV